MQEAATARPIESDKAQRIVDAMRSSVARRGVAGSTFDHVAREAGVSRGLLHYYFGTKERLLAEVVRRETATRLPLLRDRLERAEDADEIIHVLVASLRATIADDPEFVTVLLELFALARRQPEIAVEVQELLVAMRTEVAGVLERKQAEGILTLRGDPRTSPSCCSSSPTARRCASSPSRDRDSDGPAARLRRRGAAAARELAA